MRAAAPRAWENARAGGVRPAASVKTRPKGAMPRKQEEPGPSGTAEAMRGLRARQERVFGRTAAREKEARLPAARCRRGRHRLPWEGCGVPPSGRRPPDARPAGRLRPVAAGKILQARRNPRTISGRPGTMSRKVRGGQAEALARDRASRTDRGLSSACVVPVRCLAGTAPSGQLAYGSIRSKARRKESSFFRPECERSRLKAD